MHNMHTYVSLHTDRNITVCWALSQLRSYQVLFIVWLDYCENQKSELFWNTV